MGFKKFIAIIVTLIFLGNLQLLGQAEINNFLKSIHGSMHPKVSWYTNTKLDSVHELNKGILRNQTSEWSCTVNVTPTTDNDAIDVTALFKLEKGNVSSAEVSVAFDFNGWSTENYVLVPAIVYNGNRYRVIGNGYNPGFPKTCITILMYR